VELIKPCIISGCPPGGVVLDPFVGSGTTGIAALSEGRNYIGIDLNPAYCALAEERISNTILA
jgi:DNA modification methylase